MYVKIAYSWKGVFHMGVIITNDVFGNSYDSSNPGDVRRFAQDYKNNPDYFRKAWDSEMEVMLDSARTLGVYDD